MSSIQPISTSRVTTSMMTGRLTSQIQQDQLELFRLQNQLSTGYRIFLPSDDASAAQRAIELQRTIERKDQSATNLDGAQSRLSASATTLSDVSDQLNSIMSESLNVLDTFASNDERQQLIEEINLLLDSLVQVGNSSLTGTYLFGGDSADAPYSLTAGYVDYSGGETSQQTFVDIGYLFDSTLPGDDVLGGYSDAVGGDADLDVQPTPDTRLSEINSGAGVTPNGAIEVTFQTAIPGEPATVAVVDLSSAETLGDVARLIETGAPQGALLTATVTETGLSISSSNGTIAIGEVTGGSTAEELGILQPGSLSATITGEDLDPTIRITTDVSDLGGTKARGLLNLNGLDNDLSLVATENGTDFNNLTVEFTDTVAVESEEATYDEATNTLTIAIASGLSTADQIAAAINNADPAVPFVAETDYRDASSAAQQGTGQVTVPSGPITGVTSGGSGGSLDLASGLRITNGTEEVVVDTSEVQNVEDLLNLLNDPALGLDASISASGDGIAVRTRRSGADFKIGENGGTTAADLGIRTYTADTRLDDFNLGRGVIVPGVGDTEELVREDTVRQNEFTITVTEDGAVNTYSIDVNDVVTVDDLIEQIDAQTSGAVQADLAAVGNGLTLIATDPDSPAAAASGSFALGADTLTIDADATGDGGNRPFTVEILANGGGTPLSTGVVGDAITVDLGGASADTDQIALAIQNALPGFTVTSQGPVDTISADLGPLAADTTGGQAASVDAVAASGGFAANGDTITFDADNAGPGGNQTFTINLENVGVDGLATTVDGTTITVNLGGADTTTDAIAASINAALPGYTVASDGNAAVLQTDVGVIDPFTAPLSGGRAADSITVTGAFAERLGFGEDAIAAPDGSLTSTDNNPWEADSVYSTLIRMRDALEAEDRDAFAAEVGGLEDDIDRVNFGRSEIGVRVQTLQSVDFRLQDEEVELRAALSDEIDADLIEVINDYTAQQVSLEASLQISSSLLQLTILDFI